MVTSPPLPTGSAAERSWRRPQPRMALPAMFLSRVLSLWGSVPGRPLDFLTSRSSSCCSFSVTLSLTRSRPRSTSQTAVAQTSPHGTRRQAGGKARRAIHGPMTVIYPSGATSTGSIARSARLAIRAPVGGAVGVALASGGDRGPASGAGLTGTAVDGARLAAFLDRAPHQVVRRLEDVTQLFVGQPRDRRPGIEAGGKARLALEDVADAGDGTLVEQGFAEHSARRQAEGEDVGAESGQDRVPAQGLTPQHPQGRAAELDRLRLVSCKHCPGRPCRLSPALATAIDVPGAAHPQVAVQDAFAKAQQQVLAVRIHPFESGAVQLLNPGGATARGGGSDPGPFAADGRLHPHRPPAPPRTVPPRPLNRPRGARGPPPPPATRLAAASISFQRPGSG